MNGFLLSKTKNVYTVPETEYIVAGRYFLSLLQLLLPKLDHMNKHADYNPLQCTLLFNFAINYQVPIYTVRKQWIIPGKP